MWCFLQRFCSTVASRQKTIFALASGHWKCGVSVIRVSGSSAKHVFHKMIKGIEPPAPRLASLRTIRHPDSGEILDRGIVIWFPGPASFTGEDVCELHVHGGLAVISGVLKALGKLPHFEPAQPGEFTKRAFGNGKLDLTQVEGLADLIHATTEIQRRQALRQMEGKLTALYDEWKKRITRCVAHVEAFIDFGEADSIESEVLVNAARDIKVLRADIENYLNKTHCGERLRQGIHVAIIGRPNVGKSSLLNILCGRSAAIVSSIPGTTRDIIEAPCDLDGYPVVFCDTAGMRESQDCLEQEGVTRARKSAESADLILLLHDATDQQNVTLPNFIQNHLKELGLNKTNLADVMLVLNKLDLMNADKLSPGRIYISCKTGDGMVNLFENLKSRFRALCGDPDASFPTLAQERHKLHLQRCCEFLDNFLSQINVPNNMEVSQNIFVEENVDLVIITENLRAALRQIGKITGKISTEDILDVIFRDFCIGK